MNTKVKKLLLAGFVAAQILGSISSVSAVERVYILPSTTNKNAPKSNVFRLNGSSDKYILLDSTDEGYFILTEKALASKPLSADGNPTAFDPDDPNSLAYWLNNDFLETDALPQVIKDCLVEREYTTEGGGSAVSFGKEYKSTCKVVVLSQTEWSKYNAKFGYADDSGIGYWALRSVRELTGAPLVAAVGEPNSGLTVDGKWSSSLGIRPAFYLSKDFFEKASVNLEESGDAVLSVIRNSYTAESLQKVYSVNDVTTLKSTDIAPVADSVSITGRGIVGEKITGTYSFVSLDSNKEDGTMIQWQKSIDGSVWSTILGAETKDFVPSDAEVGYYVRMKVSPMTSSMAGASFTSTMLANKIRPISKPAATNVRILTGGNARPGDILDVKYEFSDENRDMCSDTEYIWEASEDKLFTEKVGDTRYLKLENNLAGKFVRVGVIPKKKTNSASGRQTVAGDAVYSDWLRVANLPACDSVRLVREADASISLSKNENTVSVKGLLTAVSGNKIEKLAAEYNFNVGEGYTVVCEWQGASEKYGTYGYIISGSDTLEFVPAGTVWVRAKIFAAGKDGTGKAVYSEPMYIGEDKALLYEGSTSETQNITDGKKYEIWIVDDGNKNSYTYSFRISGNQVPDVVSDKYLVRNINEVGGVYVLGTMISDVYMGEACFKAGEITAENNTEITISDVQTASADGVVTCAKVFVSEK